MKKMKEKIKTILRTNQPPLATDDVNELAEKISELIIPRPKKKKGLLAGILRL